MSYPCQPVFDVLPQFRGTASVRQTAIQRRRLIKFVAAEYQSGRSLRDLAEQTGRTQTAVRRALDGQVWPGGAEERSQSSEPETAL
jgi:hypothetical protein